MKLFIKRLFFFTVVTILAYILILLLFSKLDKLTSMFSPNLNYRVAKGGHLYTRLKDIEHYSHVELLVIGSSHAYRGFDPRIFKKKGVEIFNLGSSAQTPIQTEILIKRYLDKLNPKVVLFEVYPGSLTSDGVESSLDLVSNSIHLDALDVEQLIKLRNIKLFNTLIVKFVYDVLGLNSNLVEPIKKYHDEYVRGGFVQNREKNSGKCENSQNGLHFNELQLESIARIEQLLKAHNTKLIYVSAPITNDFKRGHPEYEMFEAFMKSKSPYYNFSSFELLKDSDHFIDCDHLNQSGVNIFNDSLLRINIFNVN